MLAVASWGAAVAGFGLSRELWLGLLFLAAAGAADSVSMVFRSTMLQAAVPDDMRGRLQGVFIVVVTGGPRIGDLLAGGGTKILSEGWVLLLGGALCIAGAWAAAKLQPGFGRYDARNPVP